MSASQERARQYRTKAEEYLRLSELDWAPAEFRHRYRQLAECYFGLAIAEEKLSAHEAQLTEG